MRTIVHSAVALLFLATAGCDRPAFMTDLALSADRLEFIAPPGSEDPPGQVLYVTNPGEGRLARPVVTIAYTGAAGGWLGVTVSEDADAPYRLDVTATAGALAPGIYAATLTLASANAPGSPVQVPVTLAVPGPSFLADRQVLSFQAPRGGAEPEAQAIAVTNGGRGTLPVPVPAITYVGRQGWLSVEVGGTPAGYSVTVRASVAGLATGEYAATIVLGAEGVAGPAPTLAVGLAVPPPELALGYDSVTIDGPLAETDPLPVEVRITNGGGGILPRPSAVAVLDDPTAMFNWLQVAVEGDASPYTLSLQAWQVVGGGMKAGVYRATVHLSAEGVEPVQLPVTFRVPETEIVAPYLSLDVGQSCTMLPDKVVGAIGKRGPGPLARPTATVEGEAATWLEVRVGGSQHPWTLGAWLKAIPPPGVTDATVRLEASDASPGSAAIHLKRYTSGWSLGITPASLRIWAQHGLGEPGPAIVADASWGDCLPEPGVQVVYPAGTPPWLAVESRAAYFRRDLVVQGSAVGLAPGERRSAELRIEDPPGSSQPVQVEVTIGTGELRSLAPMLAARGGHALVVLQSGDVVAFGGQEPISSSTERYDVASGVWKAGPQMTTARTLVGVIAHYDHALVFGGGGSAGTLSSYEGWELTRSYLSGWFRYPRTQPAVVAPNPNRVVIASWDAPPEVLELSARKSVYAAGLHYWSKPTSAVKLADGRVLLAGGPTAEAILYDPAFDEWSYTGALSLARGVPALELLPDGRVLAVGGHNGARSAELWDPVAGTWSPAGRPYAEHTAGELVTLTNGKVLAFGGWKDGGASLSADVEMYDPATDTWTVAGTLPSPRQGMRVVRLQDGMVLAAGGFLSDGSRTAEVFGW